MVYNYMATPARLTTTDLSGLSLCVGVHLLAGAAEDVEARAGRRADGGDIFSQK